MIEFLKNIIRSKSEESSKRLIAIWAMVLISIVVFVAIYKNTDLFNIITILIGFVCTLLGIATWQNVKEKNEDKD